MRQWLDGRVGEKMKRVQEQKVIIQWGERLIIQEREGRITGTMSLRRQKGVGPNIQVDEVASDKSRNSSSNMSKREGIVY